MNMELAGWLYSKICSQQLDVHVEISDEWCCLGVGIGAGVV